MLIFRAVFILLVLAILSIGVYMIALQSPMHTRCNKNKTEHFEYVDNNNIEAGIKMPQIQTDDFTINKNFIVGTDKNYTIKSSGNTTDPVDIPKISTNEITLNGKNILEVIYPVGSIYMSVDKNKTNPKDLFGFGSWTLLKQSHYLISCGADENPLDSGGSAKIEEKNLPKHSHDITSANCTTSEAGEHKHPITSVYDDYSWFGETSALNTDKNSIPYDGSNGKSRISYTDNAGKHEHTVSGKTEITGSGTAFWQPYIRVLCWQRTA